MAEAFVNVTEGAGKKLHAYDRVIGANTVLDEVTLQGEQQLASYSVATVTAVSAATSSDHLIQLMAGASLNVRIRHIRLDQGSTITAAALLTVGIYRLTTAGTGGTTITPSKYNNSDAASGATAMTLPGVKGTEGTLLDILTMWPVQTAGTGGLQGSGPYDEWVARPDMEPIIIPAGAANGIALKVITGRAGLTVYPTIEFVETSF